VERRAERVDVVDRGARRGGEGAGLVTRRRRGRRWDEEGEQEHEAPHGRESTPSVTRIPQLLHILYYDYGDDIVTRRAPHREAHLAYLADWHADGRLLLGGAVGNPPDRGVLVFAVEDPAAVEAFAAQDPYVVNGLVPRGGSSPGPRSWPPGPSVIGAVIRSP